MPLPQHDATSIRFAKPLATAFLLITIFLHATNAAENYKWDSVRIGGGGYVTGIITNESEPDLVYARTDVGGAYRWDADDSIWIPLNDWTPRETSEFLGVESLATDPNFPNRLYMVVGWWYDDSYESAFLRSDDYGATFERFNVTSQFRVHGNGMGRQNGEKLQIDPHNSEVLYCGSRNRGVFKSLDRGTTWTRLDALDIATTATGNGISFLTLDPSDAANGTTQTLYAGVSRVGENLYRSTDGGATFSPVAGGPANLIPQRAALATDGTLYLTYGNGAGPHANGSFPYDKGGIWKLDTSNDTWTNITPSGYTNAFGGISVDLADPQRIIASSTQIWLPQDGAFGDRFFLSTDGGTSWIDLVQRGFDMDPNGITWIEGYSIHWSGCIEFDPFDTNVAWVISGNGIYRCDDLSATESVWIFSVQGIEETVPLGLVSIKDGPLISVIGDYNGFRHEDPARYAPVHSPNIGTTSGLAYARSNSNLVYRAGDNLQRSTDQGQSWTDLPNAQGQRGELALSADGATLLHNPEDTSTTYRSTDQGVSWSSVSGLSVQNARPHADAVNSDKFYVAADSTFYRSTDNGATFTSAAVLPAGGLKRLATVPEREGELWLSIAPQPWESASNLHGLYHSTDSGSTFTRLETVEIARTIGTGKAAVGSDYPTLYIWGTIDSIEGVFRSTDQGATWLRINDDAHQYGGPGNEHFIVGDQNVFGRVYLSTAGRGIAYGELLLDSISYLDWTKGVFTTQQQADSGFIAETADPDGDSLNNLLEWVLQTDPLETTNLADQVFAFSANAPKIVLQQLANLSSATLTINVSTDLKSWSDITTVFQEDDAELASDSLTRTRAFQPISGIFPHTLFIRAKATR